MSFLIKSVHESTSLFAAKRGNFGWTNNSTTCVCVCVCVKFNMLRLCCNYTINVSFKRLHFTGSITTYIRCGGNVYKGNVGNLLLCSWQGILKIKVTQSYCPKYDATLFDFTVLSLQCASYNQRSNTDASNLSIPCGDWCVIEVTAWCLNKQCTSDTLQ